MPYYPYNAKQCVAVLYSIKSSEIAVPAIGIRLNFINAVKKYTAGDIAPYFLSPSCFFVFILNIRNCLGYAFTESPLNFSSYYLNYSSSKLRKSTLPFPSNLKNSPYTPSGISVFPVKSFHTLDSPDPDPAKISAQILPYGSVVIKNFPSVFPRIHTVIFFTPENLKYLNPATAPFLILAIY